MRTGDSNSPSVKPRRKWLRLGIFRELWELFQETEPSPGEMALRLRTVERDVILPVKGAFFLVLLYFFYLQPWYDYNEYVAVPRWVAWQIFNRFFHIYTSVNVVVALILWKAARLSGRFVQWTIFVSNFLDALFFAGLVYITGGFDSLVYWMFLGLIVRNALSCPRAWPQLVLNVSVTFCYLLAGLLDVAYPDEILDSGEFSILGTFQDSGFSLMRFLNSASQAEAIEIGGLSNGYGQSPTQPILIRVVVLLLWALCCYGVQVLLEKQRQAQEEAKESTARQTQLESAGRMAGTIAHQIKNPLGIINTLAFSLQSAVQKEQKINPQQLAIIREEVARADSIITQLMGYAQLAEGRVERLNVAQEIDRAIREVFPPGTDYGVRLIKQVASNLPALLMQRAHLSQIFVNLLLNAREAVGSAGRIQISAHYEDREAIVMRFCDTGPGIAEERIEKVFEPYFSTKEQGTGLGLSIVRHNIEIYGGRIRAESELGKGVCFVLHFPTRTFMKHKT